MEVWWPLRALLPAFSILDCDSVTSQPLRNATRPTSQSPGGASRSSCTYPWRRGPRLDLLSIFVCLQWAMRPSTGLCTEDIWSSTSWSRSSRSFMVTFPHACAPCSASRTTARPPSHPQIPGWAETLWWWSVRPGSWVWRSRRSLRGRGVKCGKNKFPIRRRDANYWVIN